PARVYIRVRHHPANVVTCGSSEASQHAPGRFLEPEDGREFQAHKVAVGRPAQDYPPRRRPQSRPLSSRATPKHENSLPALSIPAT
ncbi:hypothetical protein MTO96_044594, partial [Rhipicephalus appendiculatus]